MERNEKIFLISLVLLHFCLGLWMIEETPPLEPDELWHGIVAIDVIRANPLYYMVFVPFLPRPYQGPGIAYLLLPSIYFLGPTLLALRLPILIIGALTLLLNFLFVKGFYGKTLAIVSTSLLFLTPSFLVLTRVSYEFLLLPFFVLLTLTFLNEYNKTKKSRFLFLSSFSLGLGIISKLNFIFFFLPLLLFFMMWKIRVDKKLAAQLAFLVLLGSYPLIVFNLKDPSFIFRVFNAFPFTVTKEANLLDLKTNLNSALLNHFPLFLEGGLGFHTPPLFTLLFATSFTLFLLIALRSRKNEKRDLFILLNFLIIFLLSSTLTIERFDHRYYVILLPFIPIIIGRVMLRTGGIKLLFFVCALLIFFYFPLIFRARGEDRCLVLLEEMVNLTSPHTQVFVDEHVGTNPLKWYFYQRGVYNKSVEILKEEMYGRVERGIYIFTPSECLAPRFRRMNIDWEGRFLKGVSQSNLTSELKAKIVEGGKILYNVYEVKDMEK